jgi:ElaB/YqjD/DUF883 family membrane-anchored ribosome-binding protein
VKANGNGSRRPDEIQADINRARDEMDATLTQIEHRLTPGQLVDQGLDYLKNSGARQYVTNLGGSVKDNPIPVTIAGIGLAWLMATANRPVQYKVIETRDGHSAPGAMDRARGATASARDTMHSAGASLGEGLHSVRDKVAGTANAAREKAYAARDSARHQVERVRGGWDSLVREHPLAIGAIGFAIGAVAAAMAPRTRREDELLGATRDRFMDQAKQAGSEKLEQAKQVAGAAMETAVQEAKQQGVAPSSAPRRADAGAADVGRDEPKPKGDSAQNPPSFVQHTTLDNGPRNRS